MFADAFLDDLRARVSVSEVVRRRGLELKRVGAEYVTRSPFRPDRNPSFCVNDVKRRWFDNAAGEQGDIFEFEMRYSRCTFVEAVKTICAIAGVAVPGDERPRSNGHAAPEPQRKPKSTGFASRQITKTYDYTDADGGLIYQVCRMEWQQDGERKKSFAQRRPVPGERGSWIWGLDAGDYLRPKNGTDFYIATEEREKRWQGAQRRSFQDGVTHGLYNFREIYEQLALSPDDRQTVFVPEGEKDCDTLTAWGCIATTNSGGAKHWQPHLAAYFQGADVIIPIDNDKPGRERAHKIASSLRGIAARVRVLDWKDFWADCPEKGDVTDWRDHAGGHVDALYEICDRLTDWVPVPPESAFGAFRWQELDRPGRELEWLVKGIFTRGERSVVYGPPGCGKSFLATDIGMAIARGMPWFDRRVRQGLVIYQAGEGGLGLKLRLRAYRSQHHIGADEPIPFVVLPTPVDIYSGDADMTKLIAEIKAWAAFYDAPLELVIIDTLSAATPGMDENASKDMTQVLARCTRIARENKCHVMLVHHTNAEGKKPRGHTSLVGNVEQMLEVIVTDQTELEERDNGDRLERPVRKWKLTKQKDGADGMTGSFLLKQAIVGRDEDNEPITSCTIETQGTNAGRRGGSTEKEIPRGFLELKPNTLAIFKGLTKALRDKGQLTPAGSGVPDQICVPVHAWQDALMESAEGHDRDATETRRRQARVKRSIERFCERWADSDRGWPLIGKHGVYVWRTDRKVLGVDRPPPKIEPDSGLAGDNAEKSYGDDEAPF